MTCLRAAFRLIAILTFVLPGFGQLQSQDLEARYLGIENGLSNNTVTTMFQDHNGFMWFGTYDGLNRFDGYEFRVFRNIIGDSNSISSNNINNLCEDFNHNIWVGGQKELSIYNPITTHFFTPSYTFTNGVTTQRINDNVVCLDVLKNNIVLAGTQHNGLFYFDNTTANGKQVPIVSGKKQLLNYFVNAIKYDTASNTTYVFVQNEGLFIYNERNHKLTLSNNLLLQANCISIGSNKKLWIGDNTGLYQLDNNTRISQSIIPYKGPVVNLWEDKKGTLWIATDGGGIWLLKQGQKKAVALAANTKKPLVNSNAIYAIYEDKQERKWIGTLRGGVNILESKRSVFKTIFNQSPETNSPAENFILSFCEDNRNGIWIGTDGAGLRYWNRGENSFKNYTHDAGNNNSISSNFITSIIKDSSSGVWISTWFGGINHFNKSTNQFQHFTCFNPVTKKKDNNVWGMMQDSRKRIWACAVRNGGLYQFNPSTGQFEMFDNSLTDLQCLVEDASGTIWGGDYASLIMIDPVNRQNKFYNVGYTVRSIHEDKKKNFWIGTQEGGLLRFNRQNGTFQRFTTANGLPHNTILRILGRPGG